MFDIVIFFFKQKTAYEMRISDWSSDVCSSDLEALVVLDTDRPAVRDVAGGDRDDPGLVLHDLQRSAPLRLPGQPPPSLPVLVGVRGQSFGKQVGDGEAGGLDDRRGVAAGEAMQQDAAVLARGNRQLAPLAAAVRAARAPACPGFLDAFQPREQGLDVGAHGAPSPSSRSGCGALACSSRTRCRALLASNSRRSSRDSGPPL